MSDSRITVGPETTTVKICGKDVVFPNDQHAMYLKWANGNQDAKEVLGYIGAACQTADDLVDDKNLQDSSGKMTELVITLTGALSANPFFAKHRHRIEPVIISSLLYWDMANSLVSDEARGTRNDRIYAYAYRELVEQTIGIIALITGGVQHARQSLLESQAYHHILNVEPFEAFEKDLGVA